MPARYIALAHRLSTGDGLPRACLRRLLVAKTVAAGLAFVPALLVLGLFPLRAESGVFDAGRVYAINLGSFSRPPDLAGVQQLAAFGEYRLYTTAYVTGAKTWYRLRLGFFADQGVAKEVAASLEHDFPGAWVVEVAPTQRETELRAGAAPSLRPDPSPANTSARPQSYAVNLGTFATAPATTGMAAMGAFSQYSVYTTPYLAKGKKSYRLRLGFFDSLPAARAAVESLQESYPGAWIAKVSAAERRAHAAPPPTSSVSELARRVGRGSITRSPGGRSSADAVILESPGNTLPASSAPGSNLADLAGEARRTMAAGDYDRSIRIYTKLLDMPEHEFRREAQELLGLARERNGQRAHAKAEYEEYLRRYPEGEGAKRVRQRLVALVTAADAPKEKLRKARSASTVSSWQTYGSFAQFYRRDASFTDPEGVTVNQSALSSDLDASAQLRRANYELRTRFSGGYLHDFLDNGAGSESRVSEFFLDALGDQRRLSARLGRQSRSSGGVLGRFDGLDLGYRFTDWGNANLLLGYPVVTSTSDSVDPDRYFYGLSLDLGTFLKRWDFNVFAIQQRVDGIDDRQAVGGEFRYFTAERSFFGILDYDLLYEDLNTALLLGNWVLHDGSAINFTFDHRNSPILTTSNALQGQSVGSISDLLSTSSESEVRQLARDRTATSRAFTLGGSHPLGNKLQVSGDFTISSISSTPASGGVDATPSTGNEFFYSTQLIGSDILTPGTIGILGLRYSDTASSDILTLSMDSRFRLSRVWRINPKLQFAFRKNTLGGDQTTIKPSVRLDYLWNGRHRLEIEAGGQTSSGPLSDQTSDSRSYFLNMGYRSDF
ncbi:MAG: SPOR domain-containing protein [Candidatus Binatia bacterium]